MEIVTFANVKIDHSQAVCQELILLWVINL